MHKLKVQHLDVNFRILRYHKGSPRRNILFRKNDHLGLSYTHDDWVGDQEGQKYTSGYFTLVRGNLVTRKSKKQKVVTM